MLAPCITIAIDIGNTRVKAGRIVPAQGGVLCEGTVHWEHDRQPPWNVLTDWCAVGRPDGHGLRVVIATTRPQALQDLRTGWDQHALPSPHVVSDYRQLGINVDVEFPERVGIDRLLNAVAVSRALKSDRPSIVVDSGSATTVDYIEGDGTFRGGAILPGFALTAKALHQYTAKLPLVSDCDLPQVPEPIGRNTTAAIHSGLYWGQIGAIRELVDRMTQQARDGLYMATDQLPRVLLTGGGSEALRDAFPDAMWTPDLTLHGLALAAKAVL